MAAKKNDPVLTEDEQGGVEMVTIKLPLTEDEQGGVEMVTIKLPLTKDNQRDEFVRVNHETWLIKRGVAVDVPKYVVEVLEHSEQAMLESIEYMNAHEK